MVDRSESAQPFEKPRSAPDVRSLLRPVLVVWPATGLVIGLAVQLAGWQHWPGAIWAAATVPVLIVLLTEIVVSLRRGERPKNVSAAFWVIVSILVAE